MRIINPTTNCVHRQTRSAHAALFSSKFSRPRTTRSDSSCELLRLQQQEWSGHAVAASHETRPSKFRRPCSPVRPLVAEGGSCVTSCIMGKSHVYPHLSSGLERATRRARLALRFSWTVLSSDWARRTLLAYDHCRFFSPDFRFPRESQAEWMDIWRKFVVSIEAELGRTTAIAWILSRLRRLNTPSLPNRPRNGWKEMSSEERYIWGSVAEQFPLP